MSKQYKDMTESELRSELARQEQDAMSYMDSGMGGLARMGANLVREELTRRQNNSKTKELQDWVYIEYGQTYIVHCSEEDMNGEYWSLNQAVIEGIVAPEIAWWWMGLDPKSENGEQKSHGLSCQSSVKQLREEEVEGFDDFGCGDDCGECAICKGYYGDEDPRYCHDGEKIIKYVDDFGYDVQEDDDIPF